jgi:molybdate transport system substrate-binding protein
MLRAWFRANLIAALCAAIVSPTQAGEITVATAANFVGTLESLKKDFEATGEHKLQIISGATGKFAAQISEGAPFDVFLSADDKATKKLAQDGHAIAETEFTYAVGTLALYSADPKLIHDDGEAILKGGNFSKLAIANPKLAPYGVAAESTIKALGLTDLLTSKIVMGENIAQAFQLIDSGNAELGFVALSQVLGSKSGQKGSHWIVPANLHEPIRQNAILLARAKDNPDARAFLAFLKSPEAKDKIAAAGYATNDD